MGHIIRGHTIITSIVVIAFLIILGWKIDLRMRTPQNFDVCFDEKFSDASKQEITALVESLDKRFALKPIQFTSAIKEQFPYIQSIQLRLVPPGTLKLLCIAYQPLCTINQTLLLMPTGTLCSTACFQETTWTMLPCIFIEQSLLKTYDPAAIVAMVHSLSADICAHYQVRLSSEGNIVFDDKKQPRLSLLCRYDKVPSKNLCMYGTYVRELLENRSAFTAKSGAHYLADLRFEKLIILSKK